MKWRDAIGITITAALGIALFSGPAVSQSGPAAHMPRGTATDVLNKLIMATAQKTATTSVSDQQISVVSINGEFNVGVGVLHRARTQGQAANASGGLTHTQITEVYQIVSGTGTLVTGGTIQNAKPLAANDPIVKVLAGPGDSGGIILGGVSSTVGPGDVVVIPPNTPHWFSQIDTDQIVYLAVRIDMHHVLPAGYPDHIKTEHALIAANVPEGAATVVKNAEIEANSNNKAIDTQLRVVGINDEYNVAVGVLHRPHVDHSPGGALEHETATEVYHIISGTGTYVTGGTIENAAESPPDSDLVKLLDGPSLAGGVVQGGVSRKVGPGDVIVIPPNTPHWFSQIESDQVKYLVIRIDPRKLLPTGYVAPPPATTEATQP